MHNESVNVVFPLKVLSLDRCIVRQVEDMRRDLFRLLGVGEFSVDAIWIPPHIANTAAHQTAPDSHMSPASRRNLLVYLAEVTCSTCNFVRDLDICRDPHLTFVREEAADSGFWFPVCPRCGALYSRTLLEAGLISQVEQIVLQFNLQVSVPGF